MMRNNMKKKKSRRTKVHVDCGVVPELPVDVVALLFNAVVTNDEAITPKNWLNMILVSKTWHRVGTRQSVKDMVGIITTFNVKVSVHDDCNAIGCSCEWRKNNQGRVYDSMLRTIRYPTYLRLDVFAAQKRCFFSRYDLEGTRTDDRIDCIRVWNGGCDVTQIGTNISVKQFFPT
jgi:hypothetical protein